MVTSEPCIKELFGYVIFQIFWEECGVFVITYIISLERTASVHITAQTLFFYTLSFESLKNTYLATASWSSIYTFEGSSVRTNQKFISPLHLDAFYPL